MDYNKLSVIENNGFRGFVTVESLWRDRSCVPKSRGVYLVLQESGRPDFLCPGVGGFFKGRDPNVGLSILRERFVPGSLVVYIGKTGGSNSKATLHSRLGQYLRFGQGKNVGHWGGRLIWQLSDYRTLVICWKSIPFDEPRQVERKLIDDFVIQFGRKPFANLVR